MTPERLRSPTLELARRYDALIDVPMHYWTEAGKQWRDKVLEARAELNRMITIMAEEEHARSTRPSGST